MIVTTLAPLKATASPGTISVRMVARSNLSCVGEWHPTNPQGPGRGRCSEAMRWVMPEGAPADRKASLSA